MLPLNVTYLSKNTSRFFNHTTFFVQTRMILQKESWHLYYFQTALCSECLYNISNLDRANSFPLVWYTFTCFKDSLKIRTPVVSLKLTCCCPPLLVEREALTSNGGSANTSSIFKVSSVFLLEVPIADQRVLPLRCCIPFKGLHSRVFPFIEISSFNTTCFFLSLERVVWQLWGIQCTQSVKMPKDRLRLVHSGWRKESAEEKVLPTTSLPPAHRQFTGL